MDVCCAICTESVTDDRESEQNPLIATKCGHICHKECIKEWLKFRWNSDHGTCPTCRQKTALSECITIYPSFNDSGESHGNEARFQRMVRGMIEIENQHDPDLKENHLVHTIVTIFFFVFSIGLFSMYIHNLFEKVSSLEFSEDCDECILQGDDLKYSVVVPLGYPFIIAIVFTTFASILFGYWRAYMAQDKIAGFVSYLWYCVRS